MDETKLSLLILNGYAAYRQSIATRTEKPIHIEDLVKSEFLTGLAIESVKSFEKSYKNIDSPVRNIEIKAQKEVEEILVNRSHNYEEELINSVASEFNDLEQISEG